MFRKPNSGSLRVGGKVKIERRVDEGLSQHHSRGESFRDKRIDLNDLLRRAKEEKKINNKYNTYISAGIVIAFAVVLLVVSL